MPCLVTYKMTQVALSTKEGQRKLPHKNKAGTQGICAVCNKYCLRQQFTKTQWDKPKQRDGNVPRTCNDCLEKAGVEDLLTADVISNADGYNPDALTRAPRPSHFRTETSSAALRDPTRDEDSGQTQQARDQERQFWQRARDNRKEKNRKRQREEGDDDR